MQLIIEETFGMKQDYQKYLHSRWGRGLRTVDEMSKR